MSDDQPNYMLAMEMSDDIAPIPIDSDLWSHINEIGFNGTDFGDFSYSNMTDPVNIEALDLQCKIRYGNETETNKKIWETFCPASSDSVLCWPPTPGNGSAVQKCFSVLMGFRYDDTQNATRQCLWNGTWSKTDYSSCTEITESPTLHHGVITTTTIYYVGYSLSLVALSIAIGIFLCFKDLRCLRNTIHTNLMVAYILMYCMWILTLILELSFDSFETNMVSCIFLVILLHYFHVTTFFWMFVEGLYLYILVVETLTRENFKLRIYVCIGWGIPLIFVIIWAIAKSFIEMDTSHSDPVWHYCPWMKPHSIDWIYQAPIAIVLLANLVFLVAIMWVLITKLRSANTLETQQYRKATKALLVLKPLLGITYVLTITGPTRVGIVKYIFDYARSVFLSTQGFMVALFYCFLNTEVQNTLRHHFDNWRDSKTIGGANRLRSGSRNKDWSPRSRTESIRLYSQPLISYQKRESCISNITTTTLEVTNGGNKTSNGGPNMKSLFLQPHKRSNGTSV